MPKAATKKSSGLDKYRRQELASIHIGKKELGLADDTYQDIVFIASGKKCTSAGDLDWKGRKAVLDRFGELGWKKTPARKAKTTRKLDDQPMSKKIRALWLELHQAGKVNEPAESALLAYVKRMTGVDRLEWLTVKQASTVIEALKKWMERQICRTSE